MSDSLQQLASKLSYRFRDPQLFWQALTHRSSGGKNNERLEFLGDALLNTVISSELFKRHTEFDEGALTRLRASLVNQEALAAVANDIDLGESLRLGPGEFKSGGQRRSSILADALEALLGAVYIDNGFDSVRHVVLHLFDNRLSNLVSSEVLKDCKTQLQEALQARFLPLPVYTVETMSGQAHQQVFEVSCSVESLGICARGTAGSRRAAEQEAARCVLELFPDV
ncbi:MAG TPA: ribonuclease III [Gammaproteobacteria bacterium]|nr:ribonuclease III [Gammaproteobacteria bacterium]